MTQTASIFRGDTGGPWNVGHVLADGSLAVLTPDYTCKIKVSGTAIDRAVTDKTLENTRFIAALTPTETDQLTPGQYVVAVEVANATLTPALRVETHIILHVAEQIVGSTETVMPPTELDRLIAHREKLLDALDAAATAGGVVQEVWNGRYGNKMKYLTMTYDQIAEALIDNRRAIDVERALAEGKPRRGGVGMVWVH